MEDQNEKSTKNDNQNQTLSAHQIKTHQLPHQNSQFSKEEEEEKFPESHSIAFRTNLTTQS